MEIKFIQKMKKKLKKAALIFAGLLACLLPSVTAMAEVDLSAVYSVDSNAWTYWPAGVDMYGDTAVLMDADTGTILYSKGIDAQRYPASITKVMTALIVAENCDMNGQVTMTETGLADAYGGSSNIGPVLGEVFTVRQCMEMLLIKSANDIAAQLAEYTAGSVAAFADLMNQKAASLGCMNTHFTNASGLEDADHYTSARDMALIMRAAIQNDIVREIMGMTSCEIPATNCSEARFYSTHLYLRQMDSEYYYPYCMGGKTGFTDISKSTLVCYAQNDGMTLIGVVLGAPETGRNAIDMIDLFNYGFNNFSHVDAASGVECTSGGWVTLPNGVGADVMWTSPADMENGEKEVTFYIEDHRIGNCTMTAQNYALLQLQKGEITQEEYDAIVNPEAAAAVSQVSETALESEITAAAVSSTAEEETAAASDSTAGTDANISAESGAKTVLRIIIIILIAAIIACIVYIFYRNRIIKARRRRTRRKK